VLATRIHWRLLVGTILILMAAAWLAPRWIRAPAIQENRVLAAAPAWPRWFDDIRAFRKAADAYVSDRFPIRPHLIATLNRLRILAGVSGSNRVIVGRDGWLFYDDDTHLGAARGDPPMVGPEVRQWLMTLAGRTEMLQARGIPYLVVAAPAKETIYPQFGPAWYHGPSSERPTMLLRKLAHDAGVGEVDYLHEPLAQATRRGWKTYSRHDTHWTGYGAYAGYAALMDRLHALGLTDGPKPLSAFEMIGGGSGNRPRDLALMLGVASFVDVDFPHIDNPAGEAKIATRFLTDKQDWTGAQVIDTGEVGKPTLLMTRDSFSNEIQPLLYPHFSRIVLAHNQDGTWRPDLIDRFKPDLVILEVVEHGLRVSMAVGPTPSAAAAARIDHVLGRLAPSPMASSLPGMPPLSPPDARTTALMASAQPTGNCNLEIVTLTPGEGGEATFTASGWMSELGRQITSPQGLVALKGPGRVFVAPVAMDKSRPDVAAFFKNPTGEKSGFVGTFFLRKIEPGAYTPTVYRRASGGWIACTGKTAVTAP
jgi:SGNH hydrolase-like domain, acetyltransferase AlgX